MEIIRRLRRLSMRNPVVALGTFDGVHVGHQKILAAMVGFAKRKKWTPVAITFRPHPQQVIVPERGLRLLTLLSERLELFKQMGVHTTVVIHFDHRFQELSYEDFVRDYIVRRLHARKVFVGYDYAFGHDREGNPRNLEELGKECGFAVTVVPPVTTEHLTVKSTLIRELLSLGKLDRALHFLGHPYRITGKVVHGSHRGKKLGFPTANLQIDKDKLMPAHGVYAAKVFMGRKVYRGAVNIGARPTFAEGKVAFEVYVLDFKGNLRGRTLVVDLFHRLRDEIQFSDVEDLKAQIREDISKTRKLIRL